jgi:hypothetical protein
MVDDDDYGAVGGMRLGRGNRSTRRKPAPVPLCPPQIPHDLGSNPGRRGGKPATNRLSCGTASTSCLTPNTRVFLEKFIIVPQLLEKYTVLYVHCRVHESRHWTIWIETSFHLISLRSILILSCHVRVGLLSGWSRGFEPTLFVCFSSLPFVLHAVPISSLS